MSNLTRIFFILVCTGFLVGCTNDSKPLVGDDSLKIIFDTDMGSDCDDVGALALLHSFAKEGKVEILGCIYSSGKVPYGAGVMVIALSTTRIHMNKRNSTGGCCQHRKIPVSSMSL